MFHDETVTGHEAGRDDRAASFQSQQAAHARSATAKPLHAALARRALLRLDTIAILASSSPGSTTLRTCSALFSSPVSLSSSDDFEIGCSHPCNVVDLNQRQMLARAQNSNCSYGSRLSFRSFAKYWRRKSWIKIASPDRRKKLKAKSNR